MKTEGKNVPAEGMVSDKSPEVGECAVGSREQKLAVGGARGAHRQRGGSGMRGWGSCRSGRGEVALRL